jgi:hypothetical protein
MRFLTIDHINGGGTVERKRLKRQGVTFYGWLANECFPPGYQTLCMNCNFAKGHWGACPHRDNTESRQSRDFLPEAWLALPA